jgi:hypothetical protein
LNAALRSSLCGFSFTSLCDIHTHLCVNKHPWPCSTLFYHVLLSVHTHLCVYKYPWPQVLVYMVAGATISARLGRDVYRFFEATLSVRSHPHAPTPCLCTLRHTHCVCCHNLCNTPLLIQTDRQTDTDTYTDTDTDRQTDRHTHTRTHTQHTHARTHNTPSHFTPIKTAR